MIDYGKGVKIFGIGDKSYENDVKDLLDKPIAHNMVAKVVLNAIDVASKKDKKKTRYVTIVPYKEKDQDGSIKCNAGTEPEDELDATPKGQPMYKGLDDPDTKEDERYIKIPGETTGSGTNSSVKFTPGMWGKDAKCYKGLFGGLADEVLFHEMIHGLRDLQGLRLKIPTEGNVKPYENQEEFLAIVIVNIYMSVKGTTKLRGSFDASIALPDKLSTSAGFLTEPDNRKLLIKLKDEGAGELFNDLRLVDATFNPIKALLNDKKK